MGYRLWSKAEGRRPKVAGRGGHLRHVVRWRYFHDIRPDDFDPLEAAQDGQRLCGRGRRRRGCSDAMVMSRSIRLTGSEPYPPRVIY